MLLKLIPTVSFKKIILPTFAWHFSKGFIYANNFSLIGSR